MAFGMSIAGLIVTLILDGWTGVRNTLKRSLQWRVQPVWYLLSLLLPAVIYLVAIVIYQLGGENYFGFVFFNAPWWGFPVLFFLLIFPLEGPLGEEVFGLRGFALPRMQQKYGPLLASLMIGAFFGGWHLPEFFRVGSSQYQLGMGFFVPFIFGEIAWSVIMTWLYNKTQGSVLVSGILFHAAFNFWTCTLLAGISYTALEAPPPINFQLFMTAIIVQILAAGLVLVLTRGKLAYQSETLTGGGVISQPGVNSGRRGKQLGTM